MKERQIKAGKILVLTFSLTVLISVGIGYSIGVSQGNEVMVSPSSYVVT